VTSLAVAVVMWLVFHPDFGWLQDTCAGGVFTDDEDQAISFESIDAAWAAIDAAELEPDGLELVPAPPPKKP